MRKTTRRAAAMLPLVMAVGALLAGGAAAQEFGDVKAGRDLARTVCAECHGVGRTSMVSPHPDAPTFRRIAAVPGMTAIAIRVILNTPHRQMPDIILTSDEVRDVAAYILTLKERD